ncbi:hypothetical protein I8748_28440 [Nostoc sp. CENA67]|uniref:Uncharacterized protein n=1 Tax=Amazonocrinis nigriterrae CENA67 TaxID=2794033 RepID=A0A8J7HYN3_9NOST|nr:hypothetical protein [Amazonocrinis nigriterrae CENA67]
MNESTAYCINRKIEDIIVSSEYFSLKKNIFMCDCQVIYTWAILL